MKKTDKKLVIFAAVLALCAVIFAVVYFASRNAGTAGEKSITVVVDAAAGTPQSTTFKTKEQFLGPALLAEGLVKGTEGQYGLFITEAGGVVADDKKQEWWCITKAGQDVATGAGEVVLADGEQYELTLKTGY